MISTIDYNAIGNRIKLERKRNNLSQEKLAEIIGVSTRHIGALERGERGMGLDILVMISDYLHVSIDYLIKGELGTLEKKSDLLNLISKCPQYEVDALYDIINAILPHIQK